MGIKNLDFKETAFFLIFKNSIESEFLFLKDKRLKELTNLLEVVINLF